MGEETWWHLATAVALFLALVEGALVLGLARVVASRVTPRQAPPGIDVGTMIPPVVLQRADTTERESVSHPAVDRVVLFVSPHCSACKPLLPTIQPVIEQDGQRWELVVVVGSPGSRGEAYVAPLVERGVRTLLDPDGEAEAAFATRRTYPLGFAVRAGGTVGSRGIANNWGQVHMLAANASSYPFAGSATGNGAADNRAALER